MDKLLILINEPNYRISKIVDVEDNTPIEELLKAFNLSHGWGNSVGSMQTLSSKEDSHAREN